MKKITYKRQLLGLSKPERVKQPAEEGRGTNKRGQSQTLLGYTAVKATELTPIRFNFLS